MGATPADPRFDNTAALIAGAGAGMRLGLGPKLFVKVGDGTLLEHTVASVYPLVSKVVVAVPPGCCRRAEDLLGDYPNTTILEGGATRAESYRFAFEHSHEEHLVTRDVSRPFASPRLIAETIRAGREAGAAAACVDPEVPAARVAGGMLGQYFDRGEIVIPTNPQCYHRAVMEALFSFVVDEGVEHLTLWQACLRLKVPVAWVPGEQRNIKITTRDDLDLARRLCGSMPQR